MSPNVIPDKPEIIEPFGDEWQRAMINKIVEQNWAILRMNTDLIKIWSTPTFFYPKEPK
jgi:hypothetical protein